MKRAVKAGIVMLLWAPVVLLGTGYARGQTSADFAGFDMGAKATAVQWVLDWESLGIPADPTGELNLAYSEVTLQSGPAAYGLGSFFWPGQVVAALPPFIVAMIEEESGGEFEFPIDVPPYPVRAETFYPQGPTDASTQMGTLQMRSSVREVFADAASHINRFGFPGIATMGQQASFAQNGFDAQGAVAIAEAAANNISIAGVLNIDSVVSQGTARTDGQAASVAGTTTVIGATVAGIPVIIDSQGVNVDGSEGPGTAAAQLLVNQVLESTGISIELSEPVDTISEGLASRSLGGLLVRLEPTLVQSLLAAMPEEIRNQIRDQINLDPTMIVALAPLAVSVGAGEGFIADDFGDLDDVVGDIGDLGTLPVTDTGTIGPAPGQPLPPAAAPVPVPGGTRAVPVGSFTGIPLWLVFTMFVVALGSTRPLMAAADRSLTARIAGGACPEGRV